MIDLSRYQWSSSLATFSVVLGLSSMAAIAQEPSRIAAPAQPISLPSLTTTPPPANSPAAIYTLGPGDQIEVTVFEYQEFNGPKLISPDGTITLPVIGSVMAADRTPRQFAQELQIQLRRYLKNPVVSVGVLRFRPLLVNVAGEVQRPGPIQLRTFTSDLTTNDPPSLPTVSAALLAAGGITRDADIRRVMLRRANSTVAINLWEAIQSEQAPPDYILKDGDALYIPKLDATTVLDRRLIAKSTFAPKTVRVRVVGEVKTPGEVQVPPSSSISSAVAIAGGPTDKAKLRDVTLVRLGEDGRVQRQTLNLANLIDSEQVLDGDVVIVPKKSSASALDFAGQLFPPLGVLFNLFKN